MLKCAAQNEQLSQNKKTEMRTKFYAENFLEGPGYFFPLTNMLDFTQQHQ